MILKKFINDLKGFTLVEVLLSIILCSLSLLLINASLHILKIQPYSFYHNEDETFINQMQTLYALSKDHVIVNDMLEFNYQNQIMFFEINDRKLILKEGYQVFLNAIDNAYFKEENHCIYLYYTRDKTIKRIIGCE